MSVATLQKPISLDDSDRVMLEPCLAYLYTAQSMSDAFSFLFSSEDRQDALTPTERLAEDLLFMWRSKLYADVQLQITANLAEPANESDNFFTCHKAILCSRVPYYQTSLLGPYADKEQRLLTLPTPPFDAAALHFTLGYIYCGSLDFSPRTFDLPTALTIWRCATYLGLDLLPLEVEAWLEDTALSKPDPIKAARIYTWSTLPDVNCSWLQASSRAIVVDRFGEAWREEIGWLDQSAQQSLVTDVCASIDAKRFVHAVKSWLAVQTRVVGTQAKWAIHVSRLRHVSTTISRCMTAFVDASTCRATDQQDSCQ